MHIEPADRPKVSVIVPVKDRPKHALLLIDALLTQTYAGPVEVIVVGDVGDPTWEALSGYIDSGAIQAVSVEVTSPGRDANAKRNIGLSRATGNILALTDSDVIPRPDWIATGVERISSGYHCVAGPMAGLSEGFMGSYTDTNMMASKTPRMAHDYVVDSARCGQSRYKLPITANVFLTRDAYEAIGGLDATMTICYEDYEWFHRIAQRFPILCTPDLVVDHDHRGTLRGLVAEYDRSGKGCADYIVRHPGCRLSVSRLGQFASVLTVGLTGLLIMVFAFSWLLVAVTAVGIVAVMGTSSVASRRPAAAVFPFITLGLGLVFCWGLATRLVRLLVFRYRPQVTCVVSEGLDRGDLSVGT